MTGRLDFVTCGLVLAGALSFGGGCARSVELEPGQGGDAGAGAGGGGASGGEGGGTTSTRTGACETSDDCLDLATQCTLGACIEGECVSQAANQLGACDDGLFCTTADFCQDGVCVGGPPLVCPGDVTCSVGVCDEATDTCISKPGNDGTPCDDGDACTYYGSCQGGTCVKGAAVNCSFLDGPCTKGVCHPVDGCVATPVNDGVPCNDNLFCTENDACQNGVCTGGAPKVCAPLGDCFVGMCDEAADKCTSVPGNDGALCDDGSPCTDATTCLAGVCGGGVPANDGALCDDGTGCTTGETCSAGLCTGGTGPTIYFADDFKDNSKGWTLGPEWQIGPAMPHVPVQGFSDPAMDHTNTSDNGVAGVVIGGSASTMLHPYWYLESPEFDTSAAEGPVILGFYRWLNSDYHPFMHNTIEVHDGTQWVTIWTTGGAPGIMEDAWTFQQYDITAHKNAAMRVRFGFDITSGSVFVVGSWNIDDVLVASAACP